MKKIIVIVASALLTSCTTPPQDKNSGGYVYIYSTSSIAIARDRADKLCNAHAYFLDQKYNAEKDQYYNNRSPSIPFNCSLDQAAYDGSTEAKDIKLKNAEAAYKKYYMAQYSLKEVRRKNADPKKYESYTQTDPDGTIRSYNFHGGKSCETVVGSGGSAVTSCE